MPYIKMEDRPAAMSSLYNSGQLNFALTIVCLWYLKEHGECYQTYNDIVGALECCKQEMYRRKIAPYEDIKIKQNGDVY